MVRTQGEIKSIVTELERSGEFDRIKAKGEKFEDQLYATRLYQDELTAGLSDEIRPKIALPSHRPSLEARQATGLLAQSLQYHVEPSGLLKRDEATADKLEVYFAHLGLTLIQPIARPTGRMQAVAPYAGWWLEANPFKLPKAAAPEREAYRKAFEPFTLKLVDWRTLRFMPDDNGKPTIAARRFEMPVLRLVKTYAKGDDPNPLVICEREFPWLRGGRGQDPDSGTFLGEKVKVWVVDDAATICHYVEKGGEYHQVGYVGDEVGDYPCPWGRTSLTLITGSYNPDAKDIENMYEPLLTELFGHQFNLDVMLSQAVSVALTPPKRAQVLPEAVALAALEGDKPIPAVTFRDNEVASLYGPSADFTTDADVNLKDLIQFAAQERDACLLPGILTNPDQVAVKDSTAAAWLNAGESADRLLDAARNSTIAGVKNVFESVVNYHTAHWNKQGQPKEAREAHYIRVLGQEPVKGKWLGDRKGEELELGPEDFEGFSVDKTLEIVPGAKSQSQKMMMLEYKQMLLGLGLVTPEDLMEVEFEDVTGQKKKVEVFRRYQLRKPLIERMGLLYDIEYIAKTTGMDYSWMLMQTPEMAGAPGVPPPSMNGGTVGGQRTDPPAMSMPDTGVVA